MKELIEADESEQLWKALYVDKTTEEKVNVAMSCRI